MSVHVKLKDTTINNNDKNNDNNDNDNNDNDPTGESMEQQRQSNKTARGSQGVLVAGIIAVLVVSLLFVWQHHCYCSFSSSWILRVQVVTTGPAAPYTTATRTSGLAVNNPPVARQRQGGGALYRYAHLWHGTTHPLDQHYKDDQNHKDDSLTISSSSSSSSSSSQPPVQRFLRIYYGPKAQSSTWHGTHRHLEDLAESHGDNDNDTTNNDNVYAVNIPFVDIYKTILFLAAAWALGSASECLGMPSLVGEMTAGFLLGPPLADFCPFPDAMVLIGNIGLIGLILESGIDIDVGQLKETGKRAVLLAFAGTTLPLCVGCGLGYLKGHAFRPAFAIGAAFAPSSLGVAGNALNSGQVLNTPIGQMIVASSVVDDVLGLILLSILGVLVSDDPAPIDFVLPFLSSFGYLLVLGYSGVTWMPRVIEQKLMPLFPDKYRELVAFLLMFVLVFLYMPLLNYSKASYLTGAFLAGLTFSQINTVHAMFVNKGRAILNWLLRIFFAATIGFYVPITQFGDPNVLKWGVIFLLAVLAKAPLGIFVPRFQKEIPEDFPYNPYVRDAVITSLAVTCRGEFNFIIASFALGEGLFDAELYSSVVLAVLLSSIVSPLVLVRAIAYYNNKSKDFLEGNHDVKQIGNTCDGYRPLYLAVQARTRIHWGMQERFKKALEEAGLTLIDHRSWHSLGVDSVDITEIFAQDTKVRIRVPSCFGDVEDGKRSEYELNEDEQIEVAERCKEIRQVLVTCLGSDKPGEYSLQVTQWKPYETFDMTRSDRRQSRYCFAPESAAHEEAPGDEGAGTSPGVTFEDDYPMGRIERCGSEIEPQLTSRDLWEMDDIAHQIARDGYVMTPCSGGYDVTGGHQEGWSPIPPPPPRRRSSGSLQRRASFDPSLLSRDEDDEVVYDYGIAVEEVDDDPVATTTIRDRLTGYVRHHHHDGHDGAAHEGETPQQPRHRRSVSHHHISRASSNAIMLPSPPSVESRKRSQTHG